MNIHAEDLKLIFRVILRRSYFYLIENLYKINSSTNKISDDLLETEISPKSHSLVYIKENSKVLGGPQKRFPFGIFTTNRTVPKWVSFTFLLQVKTENWTFLVIVKFGIFST